MAACSLDFAGNGNRGSGGNGALGSQGGNADVTFGTRSAGSRCNANTCAGGCCQGDICMTGDSDQRCGIGGVKCTPCERCYRCAPPGVCALNPDSPWKVLCSSATIAPSMPSNVNGTWDTEFAGADALPDPFCQSSINGVAQMATMTLLNTLAPVWNQSIVPEASRGASENFLVSQPWVVSVIDEDFGVTDNGNDLACSIEPRLTAGDFAAGTVTFPTTQRCTSLTISLVCDE